MNIDKAWLVKQGVQISDETDVENMLLRVRQQIHRQIFSTIPGELTSKQLDAYDKMWEDANDLNLEAQWIIEQLPNHIDFVGRAEQTVQNYIQAAAHKERLIENWRLPESATATKSPARSRELKFDSAWFEVQGLANLDSKTEYRLSKIVYTELEKRVGNILANKMTTEQLDQFDVFIDKNDDEGSFAWLKQNFPDYKKIVDQQFAKLSREVKLAKNKQKTIENWAEQKV